MEEEIKFVSLFPLLNKKNIDEKRKRSFDQKKTKPINILLCRNDFNSSKKRVETDFLKNRVKFFSPNITSNNNKKIENKTEFKVPNKYNKKGIYNNKLLKTINIKNIPLYIEQKPLLYKIFDKFEEINKKYNEQTKYYNHFIKSGVNSRKIHTNNKIGNLTTFSLISKNNAKKQCNYIYKRIKSIQ